MQDRDFLMEEWDFDDESQLKMKFYRSKDLLRIIKSLNPKRQLQWTTGVVYKDIPFVIEEIYIYIYIRMWRELLLY